MGERIWETCSLRNPPLGNRSAHRLQMLQCWGTQVWWGERSGSPWTSRVPVWTECASLIALSATVSSTNVFVRTGECGLGQFRTLAFAILICARRHWAARQMTGTGTPFAMCNSMQRIFGGRAMTLLNLSEQVQE